MSRNSTRAAAGGLATALAWGGMFSVARTAFAHVGPLKLTTARFIVASIALVMATFPMVTLFVMWARTRRRPAGLTFLFSPFAELSLLRFTTHTCLLGTLSITVIPAALRWNEPATTVGDIVAVGWQILSMALPATVLAVLSWNDATATLGAANGALFINLVPVTAFVIEAIRGRQATPGEAGGAAITLLALVGVNLVGRRTPRAALPTDGLRAHPQTSAEQQTTTAPASSRAVIDSPAAESLLGPPRGLERRSGAVTPRYPSRPAGGMFVASLGMVTIASAVLGHAMDPPAPMAALFFPGLALAVAVLTVTRRRLSATALSATNRRGLMAGFAVETVGLTLTFAVLADSSERTRWLVVLAVVGLHFLPMRWTHGPAMAALGLFCATNAAVGLLVPGIPFLTVAFLDGAAKLAAGLWMMRSFAERSECQPTAAPSAVGPTC